MSDSALMALFDTSTDPLLSSRSTSYIHSPSNSTACNADQTSKRLSTLSLSSKPRIKPCYDWVFSSASNVHIAIDRCAFKVYTPFDSYVSTLAEGRLVSVIGIGTVELKIKRRPDSRESHTIQLTNVLHVPQWMCNIFSDVFFGRGQDFEYEWKSFGIQLSMRENGKIRPWGYTQDFCSLDRLVLAKAHRNGRSPMLEDRDREIFSVNVSWPQSQRDRWAGFLTNGRFESSTYDLSQSSPSTEGSAGMDATGIRGGDRTLARYVSMTTLSGLTSSISRRASNRHVVNPKTPTTRRRLIKRSL